MAFGIDGDPKIRSNYAGQPMLNPVAALSSGLVWA